jgi:phosphoribosylamine--glycine ligase
VRERGVAFVVKADGLALGKASQYPGITAETHGRRRWPGAMAGPAGVSCSEQPAPGLSVFAICDGSTFGSSAVRATTNASAMATAAEHGAGACRPCRVTGLIEEVGRRILEPTLAELRRRGCPFMGFLYAGLMLTTHGPALIEFNARLGDPEAQALLPLLPFDLVTAMEAAIDGRLASTTLDLPRGAAVCVVLASRGYPGTYATGLIIDGLEGKKG